jgi:hypothetical protein
MTEPLRDLVPLVENLVSVLLTQDYKSAELTALLIWMSSHCNVCGCVLTAANQPNRREPLCDRCI